MGTVTNDAAQDITQSGKVGLQQNGRAYVWDQGVLTPAAGVPNGNTQMRINELDHIAGSNNLRAYIWRDGVTTPLGTLENDYTFAYGVNDLDQVVGTSYRDSMNCYRGFLWQNGTMIDIGSLTPNGSTNPTDINNAGQIVGYCGGKPFLYQNNQMSQLPIPSGYVVGQATAISPNGNIAGSCQTDNWQQSQGIAWINGQMQLVGLLPDLSYTDANGVNDLGQVVGVAGPGGGTDPTTAFLWQNGQIYDLNAITTNRAGLTVNRIYGINDAGEIVGAASSGVQTHAVLLVPVPEPSALALLGFGVIGLLTQAWRRRRV